MSSIKRNLTFGAMGTGLTLFGGIALVPLFLHAWGTDPYGQWLVLSAVPSTLSLAEFGLNGAFANAYVIAAASGQEERARCLASTVWKVEICILSASLALLTFAVALLPVAKWIGVHAIPPAELAWCVLLLAINTACGVLSGYFAAFFRAADRNSTLVASNTAFKAVELLTTAAILVSGAGIAELCAALAAGKIIQLGWTAYYARLLTRGIRLLGMPFSKAELFRIVPSGLGFLGYSLGNALVNQGAVLGVQQLLGPSAVTQLSVGRQLGRVFLQGTNLVFASLHPEMNLAFARGDLRRVATLQAHALFPIVWLSPLILVGAGIFGPTVVHSWTAGAVAVTSSLAVVLTAESLSYGMSTTALLAAWSCNRHAAASLWFVSIQVIALAVGLWNVSVAGTTAVGIAFVIANLAQTVLALRLTARVAETQAWTLCRAAIVTDPWGLLARMSGNR